MAFSASDVVSLSQALAPELAKQAKLGAEMNMTNSSENCFVLIADAMRGLADIEVGRTYNANAAIASLQQRRATSTAG